MRGPAHILRLGAGALALAASAPLTAQLSAPAFAQAPLLGGTAPRPEARELAVALLAHDGHEVTAEDLRAIACDEVSHAPGALDCRWEQRTAQGWRPLTTWLAQVGESWAVLDAPIPVPDFQRGRLKSRADAEHP